VVKPAQGSGGGVVGTGAWVVVVVGSWRRGGRGRLPVVRAPVAGAMAPPATVAPPKLRRPLSTDLRDDPAASAFVNRSNRWPSTSLPLDCRYRSPDVDAAISAGKRPGFCLYWLWST
jgi:hypothetical protein